jgi:hypothetical protein
MRIRYQAKPSAQVGVEAAGELEDEETLLKSEGGERRPTEAETKRLRDEETKRLKD